MTVDHSVVITAAELRNLNNIMLESKLLPYMQESADKEFLNLPNELKDKTNLPFIKSEHLDRIREIIGIGKDVKITARYGFFGVPVRWAGDYPTDRKASLTISADAAVVATKAPGGIDMNSANLAMLVKRDGNGVPLPVTKQNLDNVRLNGLEPRILSIVPATSSPLLADLVGLTH